jgi:hypothetical protein
VVEKDATKAPQGKDWVPHPASQRRNAVNFGHTAFREVPLALTTSFRPFPSPKRLRRFILKAMCGMKLASRCPASLFPFPTWDTPKRGTELAQT